MSNWNDNRTKKRRSSSIFSRPVHKQSHPKSGDENIPADLVKVIQDEPLLVDIKRGHSLPVIVTGDSESVSILWIMGLVIAIAGLILIIVLPMASVYHQLFWAIALLIIVVAVKR